MITSLVIALVAFVFGVIAATRVKPVAAVAVATVATTYNGLLLVQQIDAFGFRATFAAYMEVFAYIAMARMRAVAATVAAVATSAMDSLVEASTYTLPDTSMYSLNVAAGSSEVSAGEYLIRDNGTWRNVYLTQHARALMGDSADVIALQPATVINASGSSKVWHLSVA